MFVLPRRSCASLNNLPYLRSRTITKILCWVQPHVDGLLVSVLEILWKMDFALVKLSLRNLATYRRRVDVGRMPHELSNVIDWISISGLSLTRSLVLHRIITRSTFLYSLQFIIHLHVTFYSLTVTHNARYIYLQVSVLRAPVITTHGQRWAHVSSGRELLPVEEPNENRTFTTPFVESMTLPGDYPISFSTTLLYTFSLRFTLYSNSWGESIFANGSDDPVLEIYQ